jgi:hypothetical protein
VKSDDQGNQNQQLVFSFKAAGKVDTAAKSDSQAKVETKVDT